MEDRGATHRDIELEHATGLGRRIGRDIGVLQNLLEAGWEPVRDEFVRRHVGEPGDQIVADRQRAE
jgi:hypothetical protein